MSVDKTEKKLRKVQIRTRPCYITSGYFTHCPLKWPLMGSRAKCPLRLSASFLWFVSHWLGLDTKKYYVNNRDEKVIG